MVGHRSELVALQGAQGVLAELAGAHQHAHECGGLGAEDVVVHVVADHHHLGRLEIHEFDGGAEAQRRRLADRADLSSRGLLEALEVDAGVNREPARRRPDHRTVHRDDRGSGEHLLEHRRQRSVCEHGSGAAENDDLSFVRVVGEGHAGHVLGDRSLVEHPGELAGIVAGQEFGGEFGSGEDLLGLDLESAVSERLRNL